MVDNFTGRKTDIFNSNYGFNVEEITLGNYVLQYQYKYNKFIELCASTNFKELGLDYKLKQYTTLNGLNREDEEDDMSKVQ